MHVRREIPVGHTLWADVVEQLAELEWFDPIVIVPTKHHIHKFHRALIESGYASQVGWVECVTLSHLLEDPRYWQLSNGDREQSDQLVDVKDGFVDKLHFQIMVWQALQERQHWFYDQSLPNTLNGLQSVIWHAAGQITETCIDLTNCFYRDIHRAPGHSTGLVQMPDPEVWLKDLMDPSLDLSCPLTMEEHVAVTIWQTLCSKDQWQTQYRRFNQAWLVACDKRPLMWVQSTSQPDVLSQFFLSQIPNSRQFCHIQCEVLLALPTEQISAGRASDAVIQANFYRQIWPEIAAPHRWTKPILHAKEINYSRETISQEAVELLGQQMCLNRKTDFTLTPELLEKLHVPTVVGFDRMEDEALAVVAHIRQCSLEGKQSIAVVAQDRLVVRRLHALLDREQIAVIDETGWQLSTTMPASAIHALLEWMAEVGNFEKMRRVFSHSMWQRLLLGRMGTPNWVQWYEHDRQLPNSSVRDRLLSWRNRWHHWLQPFQESSAGKYEVLFDFLLQYRTANEDNESGVGYGTQTFAHWQMLWNEIWGHLNLNEFLSRSSAGTALIELQNQINALVEYQRTVGYQVQLTFVQWQEIWLYVVEKSAIHERNELVSSENAGPTVHILPLNGTRLRQFDAIVVMGCDQTHLPSRIPHQPYLQMGLLRRLGLLTASEHFAQQAMDLAELLISHPTVMLTWQRFDASGNPQEMSPWLLRLFAALESSNLATGKKQWVQDGEEHLKSLLSSIACKPQRQPGVTMTGLIPSRWSATMLSCWQKCHWQFFARAGLGLLPEKRYHYLKTVYEPVQGGTHLHSILQRFHQSGVQSLARLEALTDEIFQPVIAQNGHALQDYFQWKRLMPDYFSLYQQHKESGWQVQYAEKFISMRWQSCGQPFELVGQIDRVDVRVTENRSGSPSENGVVLPSNDSMVLVLDYKFSTKKSQGQRFQQHYPDGQFNELDMQKIVYHTLLANDHGHEPARNLKYYFNYIFFKEKVQWQSPKHEEMDEINACEIIDQLHANLQAGFVLEANGHPKTCQYCHYQRVCRRNYWLEAEQTDGEADEL